MYLKQQTQKPSFQKHQKNIKTPIFHNLKREQISAINNTHDFVAA
jgi:hypothetical protein